MASLETAYEQVAILTEDFKNNEKYYILPEYSEAQARKDFIDKFFIALGWDVNHEDQKDPYKQEVKVERGVYVRGAQRRADYSFSIAPNYRDPKFFVEAKKPSRQLENTDDYFQAVRYGWNTQNPLVVLTDFEELHILDSRFRPDIKSILNYCHQKYHYSEYLDREKFKKIYYLFSREAVENSSIENYVKELPKPKGKKGIPAPAVKSFDQAFLDELDETRESLARAFKRNNNNLTGEELTEVTQRVIDRLVFIRFLEDKLIEGERHISSYGSKKNTAWHDFIADCRTLDAKYNGIVFKKHFIDETTPSSGKCLTLPLTKGETVFNPPEDKEFAGICDDFSHVNSPYDFNFIPIHILGSIYERFLGKVVHATAKQVRVEEKPEVRKAGGVYYTPQYIVKYIVDNTVGKILSGETKDHPVPMNIGTPLLNKEGTGASPPYQGGVPPERSAPGRGGQGLTPKQISKLRFADISCGSGSFLITVFDTLLDYHGSWYQAHPKEAKADGCILKDGRWILSLKLKRDILLNNIYGVDIDYQAVEVTQLSLFLKLLEDETLATAYEMQTLFKERILPDLSKNIVCGNSLIGRDIFEGELFNNVEPPSAAPMVRPLPPLAKGGRSAAKGGSELDEKKINAMNFEDRFPHIFPPSKGGMGDENQGFDAIVGNPPYVFTRDVEFGDNVKNYYKRRFLSLLSKSKHARENQTGKVNLYGIFLLRGIGLIKENGLFSYILPNTILRVTVYEGIRKYILDNYNLETIVDLKSNVFENVTASTVILIIGKSKDTNVKIVDNPHNLKSIIQNYKLISKDAFYANPSYTFNIFSDSKETQLFNKFKVVSTQLGDLVDCLNGIATYKDKKGFSDKPINKKYKKLLMGKDIARYCHFWSGKYIEYDRKKLQRARDENIFLSPEKLIMQRIGGVLITSYDDQQFYTFNSVNNLVLSNNKYSLKYILGIINSALLKYYYVKNFTNKSALTVNISKTFLDSLPIYKIDFSNSIESSKHDKMVSLVNQMLEAKKKQMESTTERDKSFWENKCNSLDRQIDSLVYELYGLTEEEIKIVEGE